MPRLVLLTLAVLIAAPAAAQPPATPVPAPVVPHLERGEPEEDEEGPEPRNEVALVLAATRGREEDATSFTIGAEYERRLGTHLGVAAELEYLTGPGRWVFAVPFVVHPARGLKLFAGPGLERRAVDEEHENLFLWRVGGGYTWEFAKRFAAGPSVSADFIREDKGEWGRAFVFGVSLGVAF